MRRRAGEAPGCKRHAACSCTQNLFLGLDGITLRSWTVKLKY